ncbi:MAG: hypothetical protein CMJ18_21880 [Phycisphaeraceae bacterium]|nr:hypothetical protein [Phycisphaeraceae bacterium]
MSAFQITQGGADLVVPPQEGGLYRYGNGFPFQAGPTTAGIFVNIRFGGFPVGDFEAGMDAVLFDDLSTLSEANAVPVTRSEKRVRDDGAKRIVIKHSPKGGFVPFGALRDDGTPHPAAGTGFSLGEALDFPMIGEGYYRKEDKTRDMNRVTEINHLAYDGREFRKVETENWPATDPKVVSEWKLIGPAMRNAIPDGDDLLYAIEATQGDPNMCWPDQFAVGLSRWRYADGRWGPVDFVPVAQCRAMENPIVVGGQSMNQDWMEPTVVRDTDGSLLFTARGVYQPRVENMIPIWRSTDNGSTWETFLEVEDVKAQSPITINTTADGTPYVVTCPPGRARDRLCAWVLRPDRSGLEEPVLVRDGKEQFGPPPNGPVWFMDHPNGQTVRLTDGAWHHLLSHRVMDRGEHGGSEPTAHTGHYVEEVVSAGAPRAVWKFE